MAQADEGNRLDRDTYIFQPDSCNGNVNLDGMFNILHSPLNNGGNVWKI